MLVRAEYLQNLFMAERLLRRHGSGDLDLDGNLLLISFDMLVLTLTFWVHKDRFAALTSDLEWLVSPSYSETHLIYTCSGVANF